MVAQQLLEAPAAGLPLGAGGCTRFATTPANGSPASSRRWWNQPASSTASARGDVTSTNALRLSASSAFTRSARSRKPSAMSPKLEKNADRSSSRSMPVARFSTDSATPEPRPSTFSPSTPGAVNSWSVRESMNAASFLGASRKSSALRVGGVSSTSRS